MVARRHTTPVSAPTGDVTRRDRRVSHGADAQARLLAAQRRHQEACAAYEASARHRTETERELFDSLIAAAASRAQMPELMREREVAALLDVSESTVRERLRDQLRPVRSGRTVRYRRADVERVLAGGGS